MGDSEMKDIFEWKGVELTVAVPFDFNKSTFFEHYHDLIEPDALRKIGLHSGEGVRLLWVAINYVEIDATS